MMNAITRMRVPAVNALILMILSAAPADAAPKVTLGQCLKTAVANSISLRNQELNRSNASLSVQSAFAPFYPQVHVSGSETLAGYDRLGEPIKPVGLWTPDTYNASANASLNLFNNFKDLMQLRIAWAEEAQSAESFRSTRQDLCLSVVRAYYQLLKQRRLVEVYRLVLKDRKERQTYIQSLFKSGVRSYSDVLNSREQVKSGELTLFNTQNQVKSALIQLNYLMNIDLSEEYELVDDTARREPVPLEKESVRTAMERRPDLLRIRSELDQSEQSFWLTQVSDLPSIRLDGSYSKDLDNYARPRTWWSKVGQWDENGSWGVTLSLQYALFEGFGGMARVARSAHSVERSRNALEQAQLDVRREIKLLCLDLAQNLASITIHEDLVDSARQALRETQARYNNGVASFFELMDAETQVLQALNSQATAIYDYTVNRARWKQAVGIDILRSESEREGP